MLIKITEKHIKNGIPQDECNCPIALAVQDAVEMSFCDDHDVEKANVIVTVHDDDINVHHHNNNAEMEHMFCVSPEDKKDWIIISDFIFGFDNGDDVEPFEVEMEIN